LLTNGERREPRRGGKVVEGPGRGEWCKPPPKSSCPKEADALTIKASEKLKKKKNG